jgi:fructose-bisphosphate aldolase class 1
MGSFSGSFSSSFSTGESVPNQRAVILTGGGADWRDFVSERNQRSLKTEIRTKERQLKKVAKKIQNAERQLVFKPEGILANLHRLEMKRAELIAEIQELKIQLDFPDFNNDEEDLEALLLDS